MHEKIIYAGRVFIYYIAIFYKGIQPVRLAGSFRCWFVKKYCWLVCVREKYCFGWKFTIVYDKPQPNEQAFIDKVVDTEFADLP